MFFLFIKGAYLKEDLHQKRSFAHETINKKTYAPKKYGNKHYEGEGEGYGQEEGYGGYKKRDNYRGY